MPEIIRHKKGVWAAEKREKEKERERKRRKGEKERESIRREDGKGGEQENERGSEMGRGSEGVKKREER